MPHARKPKGKKRESGAKDVSSKSTIGLEDVQPTKRAKMISSHKETKSPTRQFVEDVSDMQENRSNVHVKSVANVKGEKIQVQTKIANQVKNMQRPSAFVRLESTDFMEQFKMLWDEHIEGFTGLRGSKRERTEKEKQMEWRKRVKQLQEKKPIQAKKNGQTVSEADRQLAIQRYREMKLKKVNDKSNLVVEAH